MGQDPQLIKERNERTREELANDIRVLSDKLNVKKQVTSKKDEVVGKVRSKLHMSQHTEGAVPQSEAGAVMAAVKEHPVALAMLGLGLTRLVTGWKSQHESLHASQTGMVQTPNVRAFQVRGEQTPVAPNYDGGDEGGLKDKVTGVGSSAKSAALDKAETAQMKAMDARDAVASKAGDVKDTVSTKASDVKDTVAVKALDVKDTVVERVPTSTGELRTMTSSNMTAWGIGAFALGAVAGLLAPRTSVENQKLGEVRENLMETAQEKVSEVKDAVQTGVQEGASAVKEGVKEGVDAAKETTKSELQGDEGGSTTGGATQVPSKRPGMITGSRGSSSVDTPATPRTTV